MSGTAKVKPPKDDAEWARNTQRRIEQVENPSSTRIGAWVLSTEPESGDLIASHVEGGAVRLASPPQDVSEADEVSSGWSHLKVSRRTPQSLPSGSTTTVVWDTVDTSTDDWSVGEGSSTLVFPTSGIWMVTYNLRFTSSSYTAATARVQIDGSTVLSDRVRASSDQFYEPTLGCSATFSVSAGSELSCTAFSGDARSIGASGNASSDVTSLSLIRLPIG